MNKKSPIVVGGHGGSGTRVIAQILMESGVYMGQDLNRELDSLVFTYFFKHPELYKKPKSNLNDLYEKLIPLHEKIHLGHIPNNKQEWSSYFKEGYRHFRGPYRHKYDNKWLLSRFYHLISTKKIEEVNLWGWKEPHTVFHLDKIKEYYQNAKYILVIRNGIDMAFTKTLQQLKYWGEFFDCESKDSSHRNILEFWYRLNSRTISKCKELFGDNFITLKHENICKNPKIEIDRILEFVGIEKKNVPEYIYKIPRTPSTYKRYLEHDLSWVDDEVRHKLYELGYYLDGI